MVGPAPESKRIDVDPRGAHLPIPFEDEVLRGLLVAQASWLATRDKTRLRHHLLATLLALG